MAEDRINCHHLEGCCEETVVHRDLVDSVSNSMPDEDKLLDLADLFKVFGDSTRIKILYTLVDNRMCVCDIAEVLNMTQSAISHQLKVLKQAKLIKSTREGKQIIYELDDAHISVILQIGLEHIEEV